jgi:heme-degrading monooxygenase HmoA
MAIMISRRKLDAGTFDAWKKRFEDGAASRKAAGCRGVRRFRSIHDPEEVVIVFDWDTHENARKFVEMKTTENPKLKDLRSSGAPMLDNIYLEEMEPLPS